MAKGKQHTWVLNGNKVNNLKKGQPGRRKPGGFPKIPTSSDEFAHFAKPILVNSHTFDVFLCIYIWTEPELCR